MSVATTPVFDTRLVIAVTNPVYPNPNIARCVCNTEVSLMVIALLVCNTGPLMLFLRMATVNVSAPSVVRSAVGVTLNDPLLLVMVNDPELVAKSPALVSMVQ